jgi:hypothetical protein
LQQALLLTVLYDPYLKRPYKEQWLRILASAAEIEAFIRENDSKLKTKE